LKTPKSVLICPYMDIYIEKQKKDLYRYIDLEGP
jgi:hypothetical protein